MSWIASLVGAAVGEAGNIVQDRENEKRAEEDIAAILESSRRQAAFLEEEGEKLHLAYLTRANEVGVDIGRFQRQTLEQTREIRDQGRDVVAREQSRAAGNGIEVQSGSPLEVAAEVAFIFEKQAALKEQNASFAIGKSLIQVKNLRDAAVASRFQAQTQAYNTLLTGIAQATEIRESLLSGEEKFLRTTQGVVGAFGGSGGAGSAIGGLFGGGGATTAGGAGQSFGSGFGNQGSLLVGSTGTLGGGV